MDDFETLGYPSRITQKTWSEMERTTHWKDVLARTSKTKRALLLCKHRKCYLPLARRADRYTTYCSFHNKAANRGRLRGNQILVTLPGETLSAALRRRIKALNQGYTWQGAITRGYPQIRFNNKSQYVHHLVYAEYHGRVPDGHEIHHLDADKLNFDPNNLAAISKKRHRELHGATANELFEAYKAALDKPTTEEIEQLEKLEPYDKRNRVGTLPSNTNPIVINIDTT